MFAEFIINPIFLILFLFLALVIGTVFVIFVLRFIFRREAQEKISSEKLVLLVRVPKESASKRKEAKEETSETVIDLISSAEVFFASLGGMKAQKGLTKQIIGRSDHLSFEIVLKKGVIYFYVVMSQNLRSFVEEQINAQYPEAEITEVDDYNIFPPRGNVSAQILRFSREFIFPVKSYRKMEGDPLSAVLSSLSKIPETESAAVQFVVRSSKSGWHKKSSAVAAEVQQGKKIDKALSKVFSSTAIKMFFGILRMFADALLPQEAKNEEQTEEDKRKLSPLEEEMVKGIEEKSSKAGLDVNIRIITTGQNKEKSEEYLHNIVNAFNQYNIYQYGNSFKIRERVSARRKNKIIKDFIFRHFNENNTVLLNAEEMASVYHFPIPSTATPNVAWLGAKHAAVPVNMPKEGILLGENYYRGVKTQVFIKPEDRRRHFYVIGKSGTGKSGLLASMARQDVINGKGICIIDPHGDLIADIMPAISKSRIEDVIYFNPADTERVMGLNLLEYDPKYPEQKTFAINEMIKIFDKLYDLKQTGGPMFEQYIRNAMLLIMEDPKTGSTLMEIPRVLSDSEFRKLKLLKCGNQVVKNFWRQEAEKAGGEAALANVVPYVTSKLTQFVANDIMRPIIGQQHSAFNLRDIMDSQKILLVNLSKGSVGEMNAYLLGMVLVGKILMASLSRTDIPKEARKDFYLYIDEFQNFITDSIGIILSEARKYGLNLTIAHQYIGQLVKNNDTSIKDAVFGNVGTLLSFQVGVEDAEVMAKQFEPIFNEYDVMNIEKFSCYMKLLIDNSPSKAFDMHTLPLNPVENDISKEIIQISRLKYAREKTVIEQEISSRY